MARFFALGVIALVLGLSAFADVRVARACGGFFCGSAPVDQTAERIVFKVHEDSVTMIVQISYAGQAQDFAWVLPLGNVPDVESLAVFPQRALTALDANTGPQFQPSSECWDANPLGSAFSPSAASPEADGGGVTVHYRAEVGPYEVAAIESEDPMALFAWLQDNQFNVNDPMLPYIEAYTDEGMKFLAAKLQMGRDTSEIEPLQFDLPGTSPSIPLRMTALAAEPEMGLLVFVFGGERYAGANWPDVEIADDRIVMRRNTWPVQTNWTALVARGVDEAGGQGWVTELAGATDPLLQLLDNSLVQTPEDEAAGAALRELIDGTSYVTRLYSRLSAEEMTSDPIFRRDAGADVSRTRMLSRYVDGVDQCPTATPVSIDPCLFASCGAGGICRPVEMDGADAPVAGCGCVDGATARTTFDTVSVNLLADTAAVPAAAVVCQDARMSFVNPGDTMPGGEVMDDPCRTFDCGEHGECLAINMTPTCVCDRGFVALGSFDADGVRSTRCVEPMMEVPDAFYGQRLPDLPAELPGGRVMIEVDPMLPVVEPRMDDLGSMGMPVPAVDPPSGGAGQGGASTPPQQSASGGCAVSAANARPHGSAHAALLVLLGLGVAWRQRKRAR